MHILLALSLLFSLHSPAHTSPGHHYGWQHTTRNPHYVKVLRPGPGPVCLEWAILNKLGDPPVCVKYA